SPRNERFLPRFEPNQIDTIETLCIMLVSPGYGCATAYALVHIQGCNRRGATRDAAEAHRNARRIARGVSNRCRHQPAGAHQVAEGAHREMEAYCLKCREKREMKDPKAITMKNGKPATEGTCPVC